MRTLALFAVAGLASLAQAATVAQWDLLGQPGTQATVGGIGATDVTANDLARGSGLSGNAGSNSINAAGWNNQPTDYFSFGFSVAAGKALDIDNLYIGSRSSNTGPGTVGLFYSGNGFSTAITSWNLVGTAFDNRVIDLSSLGNLTGNVEFRIMQIGTGSAGGGVTGATGTFRLTAYFVGSTFDRNMQFNGTVIPVPTPGALALMGLGGLVAGRRRR